MELLEDKNKNENNLHNNIDDSHICKDFFEELLSIYQEKESVFDKYFYDHIKKLLLSQKYIEHIDLIELYCKLQIDSINNDQDLKISTTQHLTLFFVGLNFLCNLEDENLFILIALGIGLIVWFFVLHLSFSTSKNGHDSYNFFNAILKCIEQIQKNHPSKTDNDKREVV